MIIWSDKKSIPHKLPLSFAAMHPDINFLLAFGRDEETKPGPKLAACRLGIFASWRMKPLAGFELS
jgi:hypothetical protein